MKRRSGLFREHCLESGWLLDGTWAPKPVLRRLTKKEAAEAYDLWVRHIDIRLGHAIETNRPAA